MNEQPNRIVANDLPEEDFLAWYGPWRPLTISEIQALLAGSGVRWWIVGGNVIDAVTGIPREHNDIDVSIPHDDLDAFRAHVADWHLWEAHKTTLAPLFPGNRLTEGRQQLWVRRGATEPWLLDLLLSPTDGLDWVFKNDHDIRLPLSRAVVHVDGIPYLAPQCVLLFKARLMREKDRRDFDVTLPHLDEPAREWLAAALDKHLPQHEWRNRL